MTAISAFLALDGALVRHDDRPQRAAIVHACQERQTEAP